MSKSVARRATVALLILCSLTAVVEARGIRFDRLSIEDGLSSATINTILQDRTGFLWLGTQDGLNRFDGADFEIFKSVPGDPTSISSSWVEALLEEESGDIWIGTQGGGLSRWLRATDSFESYRHDPADPKSLAEQNVRSLLSDRHGRLWVGTMDSGLDRLDPRTGAFTHFRHDPADPRSISHDEVRALLEDSAGRIWIGTLGGGLNLFEPDTGTFHRFRHDPADPFSLNDDTVRAVVEDPAGYIWVATHGGLARIDPQSYTLRRYSHDPAIANSLTGDTVRSLFVDRGDRLWVGTDSGLNLLETDGEGFRRYRYDPADPTSLSNDRISTFFQDRGGILWVGTQGGGLCRWDPRGWSFSNDALRPTDLSYSDVLALSLDKRNRLWIGTSGGGIDRLDRTTGEITTFRHDPRDPGTLSHDRVTALLIDRRGTPWVGTYSGGLNRFDEASGTFRRYTHDPARADSLAAPGVMSLFEDRQGRLWVGTAGGGLNRLDRSSGAFERWSHDSEDPTTVSSDLVSSFAEAGEGQLWVGTFGGGLNRFEPGTGEFLRIQNDPELATSLSNDAVLTLFVDAKGVLWVGTRSGLNRLVEYDEATGKASFQRYFERDGLPSEFLYGILPDDQGHLWISTNSGLSRFDPETETFTNYDESHGLQSLEFNMNAFHRAADGELFFGGIAGYNAFYPDLVGSNPFVPPVVITGFSKLNQPVDFGRPIFDVDEIELDYRDNVFSFEFAALDYTAPEKNRYRYQLEGFDPAWVNSETRRRVTFTNLDPDTYTFRVQGSNNDGVWNEQGASVRIVIPPPFWMTWWFRGLLGLFALGLVSLYFQVRTRSIRQRGEELQALVEERTSELEAAQEQLMRKEKLAVLGELAGSVAHELRNPLGAIKNSTFFLRMTQPNKDEKVANHLNLIDKQIVRSNRIISELLDFGRSPTPQIARCSLHEVIEEALQDARPPSAVSIVRRFAAEPVFVEADPGQLNRILVNLIRNAVQAMTDDPEITVSCRLMADKAILEVADNGMGISESNLSQIFEPLFTSKAKGIGLGLALSQRYAALNGGQIECESRLGEGATFRLTLPAAADQGLRATG